MKRSRVSFWLRRIVVGLGGLALVLLAVGAAYQVTAGRSDMNRFRPTRELVEVDGRALRLHCAGEGSPAIILESALGESSYEWELVQPGVASFTKVCSWDRPGLGWSDASDRSRHSGDIAETLAALLTRAGIAGPYVLVGHSAGGLHVRSFAHRHEDQVAGMVLVESAHENQALRLPPAMKAISAGSKRMLTVCEALSPVGIVRLAGATGLPPSSPLPAAIKPEIEASMNRTDYCRAVKAEMEAFDEDTSASDPPVPLGAIPLIVITQGIGFAHTDPSQQPPGMTPELARKVEDGWTALQRELVSLSTEGVQIIAERSGHYVPLERPDVVIDAIRQVIAKARR